MDIKQRAKEYLEYQSDDEAADIISGLLAFVESLAGSKTANPPSPAVFDWRPVSDNDWPPTGQWIMTKREDAPWPDIRSNRLSKCKDGLYRWDSGDDFGDITHWAPLPE